MEAGKRKKLIAAVFVALAVIAGGVWLYNYLRYNSSHEQTDNAQIEGDVIPIIPRTSGYITSVGISDNQSVKKGDTLFLIDDRELKTKVDQAQAALDNAVANLSSAQSLIRTGQANLQSSLANAQAAKENIDNAKARLWKVQVDYERYTRLLEKRSTTQQQFDAARTDKLTNETQLTASEKQYQAAVSQAAAAQAQIVNYQQQVSVARSVIKQRQQDLDYAQLQYSYAVVTAPEDGFVYKRMIQIGQYVQPGGQLFYMIPATKMWVVANFKETQINRMRVGQEASISIDALGGKLLKGKVLSFSRSTGSRLTLLPPDNATGNFVKVVQRIPVKIAIEDQEPTVLDRLSVGMNVLVTVNTTGDGN